jgi:hypothetical protein
MLGHTSGMSILVPILSYHPPPQGNPPGGGLSLKVSKSPTYSEKIGYRSPRGNPKLIKQSVILAAPALVKHSFPKGYGSPQGNPKLIKQSVILAAPALVKHSFPRKMSELGVTASSLFQGTHANKTADKRLCHNLR